MTRKIAVIRIRGEIHVPSSIKDTLFIMRLRKKYSCVIVEENPTMLGRINKVKDYVTYGYINPETEKLLIEKRGKKDRDGKLKKYFSLNPPRGGFERKGTKKGFNAGGALGNRKEKINDLIKRMI